MTSATDLVEIGNIETTVTFPSDANTTPHFWMSFIVPEITHYLLYVHYNLSLLQAPTICPGYQTGFYNITVYDGYGNVVKIFSQTEYTQETEEEPVLIVKGVRSGLILNEQYIVAVTVESLGVYHHQRKNFSKYLAISESLFRISCYKLLYITFAHNNSITGTNYARHCSSSMGELKL